MSKPIKHIAVTGGAGHIADHLLPRLGSGEVFGQDQPIALHILEIESALSALQGVKMELEDCAFPLLKEVHIGSDPKEIFQGVHFAILIGAKPRGAGMERAALLNVNARIFVEQGKALNEVADPEVKVLVVGNPCNTNCLTALHNAPRIPARNFFAMTRLDQNRAMSLLAAKANADVAEVTNVAIWGNHSSSQVPDFIHAQIGGKPTESVIKDQAWLENTFFSSVQKRGAAVIATRGKSSAASAANAIVDTIQDLYTPTSNGHWFSLAVYTKNNPYGIDNDLVFSFPCRSNGEGDYEIVKDLQWNAFLKEKMRITEEELKEERGELKKVAV